MGYKVIVDIEQCEGCGDCVDACPDELIELQEKDGKKIAVFSGDPEDCLGCVADYNRAGPNRAKSSQQGGLCSRGHV